MKDRIRLIMEDQQLTQQSFAQLLEIAPATLCNIFNGRTKPTLTIVEAIRRKFPNISLDWLLSGTLPMYVDAKDKNVGAVGQSEDGETVHRKIEGLAFQTDDKPVDTPQATSPSLFDQSFVNDGKNASSQVATGASLGTVQKRSVNNTLKNSEREVVKIIDKPQRKITEIRIFYDDQTWETFVPKK